MKVTQVNELEGAHHDVPAVLQLHSWVNSPLPLSAFAKAALSPSRELLLLQSHDHEVLLLALGGPSKVFPSPSNLLHGRPSGPDPSSSLQNPSATPATPLPVGLSSRTLSSPAGFASTTYESPFPFQTPPTSTYFTPSFSPLSAPPSVEGSTSSSAGSPRGLSSLSYPILCNADHVAWACHGDGFGSKGPHGLFKELLFTSNREGLFIHCLSHKSLAEDREISSKEPNGVVKKARERTFLDMKRRYENWRNLGQSELDTGLELRRRLDDSPQRSDQVETVDNAVERPGSGELEAERLKTEQGPAAEAVERGPSSNDEHGRKNLNQGSGNKNGLLSYIVDAELEDSSEGRQLRFNGQYRWPSSAEVVSFKFGADSPSFSLLTSLKRIHSSDHNDPLTSDANNIGAKNETEEGLNSEQPTSVQGSSEVVDIISNPDYSLVGIVTGQLLSEAEWPVQGGPSGEEEGRLGEKNGVDQMRLKVRFIRNALVSIVLVLDWGIKWITCIDLKKNIAKVAEEVPWVSLVLANDKLLGLKVDGGVFIWGALSGSLVAFIDVVKHCGLRPSKSLRKGLVSASDESSEPGVDSTGRGRENHDLPKCQFTNLVVTANCLLLAVTDDQGILFLVSTDDYFAAHCSHSRSPSSPMLNVFENQEDMKVLSYWDVAGSDIGGQLPSSHIPDRRWLKSLHQAEGDGFGRYSSAAKTQSNGPRVAGGRDSGPGPPIHEGALQVATGFTSRMEVSRKGAVKVPLTRAKHPFRRVFLPYNRSEAYVSVALSLYGITAMMRPPQNEDAFTITQNVLCVLDGVVDERDLNDKVKERIEGRLQKRSTYNGDILAFCSQGFLYMVTSTSLHVVLPPSSMSWSESGPSLLGPQEQKRYTGLISETQLDRDKFRMPPRNQVTVLWHWETEVLDRALICDGMEEAEVLCFENGWSLQLLRLRRLQLALDFVRADDIEQALEALVHVGAAESGVLCVLFSAAELMLNQYGSDNELAQASGLLSLAASFSTRLVRQHGTRGWQGAGQQYQQKTSYSSSESSRYKTSVALGELAHFLEVIRTLQDRLQVKRKGPNSRKGESGGDRVFVPSDGTYRRAPLEVIEEGNEENITPNLQEQGSVSEVKATLHSPGLASYDIAPFGAPSSNVLVTAGVFTGAGVSWELSPTGVEGGKSKRRPTLESPGEMFARWDNDNVDAAEVVRDALKASGRLALAVAQLHRLRMKSATDGSQNQLQESDDVFSELLHIGYGIVYELFCKGKTALAMAALRRLGEDIETALRELALGTVRRFLRAQAVKELQRLTRLSTHDFLLLERVSLVEKIYTTSSFWSAYGAQKIVTGSSSHDDTSLSVIMEMKLTLVCDIIGNDDLRIQCGEVDGAVLGSWSTIDGEGVVQDINHLQESSIAGYWAAAAVWLQPWDQLTVDRILLEQPLLEDQLISWEAKLEFNIGHHNWQEVVSSLEMIPSSLLHEGVLHVRLDCDDNRFYDPLSFPGISVNRGSPRYGSSDDLEIVEAIIPKVKILELDLTAICSSWMLKMIEERLVKDHIFLRVHWDGTVEVASLFARAGLLFHRYGGGRNSNTRSKDGFLHGTLAGPIKGMKLQKESARGVHDLVMQHCVKHTLPHFLELYLDFHSLALDKSSYNMVHALVGDCQWALWLLYSRLQRREYDTSFANACTILDPNLSSGRSLEITDMFFLPTVDDMAEAGGEIMALSTLMYAPVALQKCLCSGSVSRHERRSWQCTLESLQPGLQDFPTVWKALAAACFGHDTWGFSPKAGNRGGLSQYILWREGLFLSASADTSLIQMMPRWLPQRVRRLLQLTVQGLERGGHVTVRREASLKVTGGGNKGSPKADLELLERETSSWEATIQKAIEEELYAPSSEDTGLGCEHHLRRGRATAAFNILLGSRVQGTQDLKSGHGQLHSSDIHAFFSPITALEEKLLSPVAPLAIIHCENPVVVSACTFFIELCGLSANLLRIDTATLICISKYFKSGQNEVLSSGGTATDRDTATLANTYGPDVGASVARALADEYLNLGVKVLSTRTDGLHVWKPTKPILNILHLLEKASLKNEGIKRVEGISPGAWLFSGQGDGSLLRSMQRSMSERWSLVTAFCRAHNVPLSTTYLASLARDNDWVGFLAEAQLEGCPLDLLLTVVSKEFTDARLQSHLMIVLKSLPGGSEKSAVSSLESFPPLSTAVSLHPSMSINAELFSLLADCEHSKRPGKAMLAKAKELRWPLLAVVASCFADLPPLSCLTTWLEITSAKESSAIQVTDAAAQISARVGAAVETTNALGGSHRTSGFRFSRKSAKRRRRMSPEEATTRTDGVQPAADEAMPGLPNGVSTKHPSQTSKKTLPTGQKGQPFGDGQTSVGDGIGDQESLAAMVVILCEQQQFLPLLRAFELFTPASSFLPFLRFLQAFSQMRISEASAHLAAFTVRLKEETHQQHFQNRNGKSSTAWITQAAIAAADAMHAACPSAYERRCLLQLLSGSDFGDGGMAAMRYRRLYWKIQLAEPALREGSGLVGDGSNLDDEALLDALEKSGQWEQARSWARQLDQSLGGSSIHHVTETQAELMVMEWKELLWDVPEERVALWDHCHALFTMHAFPALRAGKFFLKHADAVESQVSTSELHNILLLALQWLSGSITNSSLVYPLHLLHELETRVWLLAVESSVETQDGRDSNSLMSMQSTPVGGLSHEISAASPVVFSPVDRTAAAVAVVDSHLKRSNFPKFDADELDIGQSFDTASNLSPTKPNTSKFKRRQKDQGQLKRIHLDTSEGTVSDSEESPYEGGRSKVVPRNPGQEVQPEESVTSTQEAGGSWEERVGEREVERAVLALLEVGQVSAAKQLQKKLSLGHAPLELLLVEAALKVAALPLTTVNYSVISSTVQPLVREHLQTVGLDDTMRLSPMEVLERLTEACREGCGRGLCRRISAIARIANFLGVTFNDAFSKPPTQLLQLLALKGQDALVEAKLLVATHSMLPASVARILAESFLKGLLAAHRGGYMESSQKEEGPAPLLWRPSDFIRWVRVCPSEPEIGHALMRLVISGRDMPHACEVELMILAHRYYESSACLDGVDVLVALAATRVDSYISEGDYPSLARLVTGISNFQALRFILDLLIENGQLELLLQKRSAVDAAMESSASIRGFRMAVLSALKHFNPHDLDAFAMVYSNFSMAHEMAALLESRGNRNLEHWSKQYDLEQSEESLEMMRFYVEAAEVYAGIDAGNKTRWCCAQASLISLQLRMPELMWLNLSDTNARRMLVEQPRFQEALTVAEAYGLNQSAEWVPVIWNQMLVPGRIDQYLNDFVAALPLTHPMLMELARFYRAEVSARGDQNQLDFSKWLTPGVPVEVARHISKSFRSLLKHTRDMQERLQLATVATGFPDVVDLCLKNVDNMSVTAGPQILRKGHGGTYVPIM